MLIQRIKVSNYKTYLDLDLDLTVDEERPIILIGGSNGGGKTTLFEAISGALYGLKIENRDHFMELVNQGAVGQVKPEICLQITFSGKVLGQEQKYILKRTYVLNPAGKPLESVSLNMNGNMFVYGTMTAPKERIKNEQEVNINTIRDISRGNSGVNIISELADRTNIFGFFGRTVDMWGGYYGVGILSKYPIVKMEKFDLSNPRNVEPRIVLCGTFELGEKRMVFAATHFDYIDPETIALQAREADAYIRKQGLPAIIAGDLNSEPGSEAINVLDASMKRLTNGQLTFPAWEPVKAIDFIYGYPAEDFKFLESHSPAPSADAPSDHLPVISTFVLEKGR